MKKSKMSDKFIKQNGIHYTPKELSNYMARILVDQLKKNKAKKQIKVLDPACGDGELLMALALILKEENIEYEMFGVDTNIDELNLAKEGLNSINVDLKIFNSDFINDNDNFRNFDLVIANPPYVRTQNMDNIKRDNTNKYAVNGRFDLYQLFFNAITNSLNYNGLMCIITSNKFMFNKAGEKTRQFLLENYDVKLVVDLGDSKMFSASVLPAIFLGEKQLSIEPKEIEAVKVYETKETKECSNTIFDLLNSKKSGLAKKDNHSYIVQFGILNVIDNNPWSITTYEDNNFIRKIDNVSHFVLSDWANVKVGIKTTADKVFIKKELRDFNIKNDKFIHEMIFSKNTNKWKVKDEPKRFILYPYSIDGNIQNVIDLKEYEDIKNYMVSNESILKGRKYFEASKKQWYEIWVSHNLLEFNKTKIVVPDISSEPKFLLDETGKLVDGNCYWITLKDNIPDEYIYLILGICNSAFSEKYHDLMFQNKLYSGKRRYVSQYLNKYPMINPSSNEAKTIIDCVKEILINPNTKEKNELIIENNIINYWG